MESSGIGGKSRATALAWRTAARRGGSLLIALAALMLWMPAGASAGTASISGTVTGAESKPLGGVQVDVSAPDGGSLWGGSTGPNGTYTVGGLPAGSYVVGFSAAGYLPGYFEDAESARSAKLVTVAEGAAAGEVDGHLQLAGSIAGTVTDSAGTPLPGIEVSVRDGHGHYAGATTAADGTYSIGELAPGSYSVRFAPEAPVAGFSPGGGNYLAQYYDQRASAGEADPVTVVGGRTATGIDARLAAGGTISGHVVDDTGASVYGLLVTATDANGEFVGSSFTDESGNYSIDQLPTGTYALEFASAGAHEGPDELTRFHGGRTTLAGSTGVAVTAGEVTEGSETVIRGGEITGSLTDSEGHPIKGARASLLDSSGRRVAEVPAQGAYTIAALEAGTYFVEFSPPFHFGPPSSEGGNFLPSYFSGQGTLASADPVPVELGKTTTAINGQLPAGGEVTGTVSASGGGPLAGATVGVYDAAGETLGSVATNSNGSYTFGGLASGRYRLRFSDVPLLGGFGGGNYAPQYDGGAATLAAAEPITVTVGAQASIADAQLQPGSSISGLVTAPGGEPVGGEQVSVSNGSEYGSATTDAEGKYTITGLAPGSYTVEFAASYFGEGQPNLQPQFFNGASDRSHATPVAVAAGEAVSGIDARLAAGGAITGDVTGDAPSEKFSVHVISVSGGPGGNAIAASGEPFSVVGLPGGTYKIEVRRLDESETVAFYGGTSLENATAVTVTAGQTTGNIDLRFLGPPGEIEGRLTGSEGQGLSGAQVTLYAADGSVASTTKTATDGSYSVEGLRPGFYRIEYLAGGYPGEFFGGAGDLAQAAAVLVVSGTRAEGMDQQLGQSATPPVGPPPAKNGVLASKLTSPPVVVLTQAQKRSRALAACLKLKGSNRSRCEAAARFRYPTAAECRIRFRGWSKRHPHASAAVRRREATLLRRDFGCPAASV